MLVTKSIQKKGKQIMKKLYRSKNNRMLSGVCGGIAEYFGIDPTLVRLLFALVTFFTAIFTGIIAYIICAVVIPEDNGIID